MSKVNQHGLIGDLWPNIKLMRAVGHFIFEFYEDMSSMSTLLRKAYSSVNMVLILIQYVFMIVNLMKESDDSNYLAENVITALFFAHCITKALYFAMRQPRFYRTLTSWNNVNSHPLFAESNARHRAAAVAQSRRLLMMVGGGTIFTVLGWTICTFFGESTRKIPDPNNMNETMIVEVPRLMLRAWYPWDASSGFAYVATLIYQFYWLLFTISQGNLTDLLFCSFLIHATEQLLHVKEILKPLIDLSSSLDTYNPSSPELFRAASEADDTTNHDDQLTIRGIYSSVRDYGMNNRINTGSISTINGIGPNGLNKKQEVLVRSAIKYWVERHKHIVRFVSSIGDAYGIALLLHMLTSTITLTLLAYQATRIDTLDLYAITVIGYLVFSLCQVFAFCIHGNHLIEESSSVMEAAYSCQWYDGSEEAKTFVQIVCQQCQKALSISGAKFFTISLDLFASVLGAFVTYFMVLVQLN